MPYSSNDNRALSRLTASTCFALLFVCACTTSPSSSARGDEGPLQSDAQQRQELVGAPCKSDVECGSSGTFCNVGYTFGQTQCVPLIANGGGFAASAAHCKSGHMAKHTCVDPAQCAPDTYPCLNDAHCCNSGRVCLSEMCIVPLADGEKCWTDAQCKVGRCSFGTCGLEGVCIPSGSFCTWDVECCGGTFCDNASSTRGSKRCATLLPKGAACTRAYECASKSCSNFTHGVCE